MRSGQKVDVRYLELGLSVINSNNNKETEEEWLIAINLWLQENPDKDINDIKQDESVTINEKKYNIGRKIGQLRSFLKKGKKINPKYQQLGIKLESNNAYDTYTEEEWLMAINYWLKQNPNKSINDIKNDEIIIMNEKKYRIGAKLSSIRILLRKGKKIHPDYQRLGLESAQKRKEHTIEEWLMAINLWLQENPGKNINDINHNEIIVINNIEYAIGYLVNYLRIKLKRGEEIDERFLNIGLNIRSNKSTRIYTEEDWLMAINTWLAQNPDKDINDITRGKKVYLNGKEYKIGSKIGNLKRRLKSGLKIDQRYIDLGLNSKTKNDLEELTNDPEDKEKAKKVNDCLKRLRNKKAQKKKQQYDISNILREFNVDIYTLNQYLNRVRVSGYTKSPTLMNGNESLRTYCIRNGYNYDVVKRIVKFHSIFPNLTLDKVIDIAINDYNTRGQNVPNRWVYESYGKLLKHKLLYLGLDSNTVIRNMTNYTLTLEEAIRSEVYRVNCKDKKYKWIEELYDYLIDEVSENKDEKQTQDDLVEMFALIVKEYDLNMEERMFLWNMFVKYVETMKDYQIVDVGLEENEGLKLDKIKNYNFDDEMIEESYFVPFIFEGKILRPKDSKEAKRYDLLKEMIINWNNYSIEEKTKLINDNNITAEEINLITTTRSNIDNIIMQYKQQRSK